MPPIIQYALLGGIDLKFKKPNSSSPVLRAIGISKEFPGVKALTDVNFEVFPGEVVALLGENGAGKSTLIKILSGVYSLDKGSIELDGQAAHFSTPGEAKAAGIGIIHQELNYVPTISIAENIFMADIPKKGIRVDYRKMYSEAHKVMENIGIHIDPKRNIGECSIAQKQLIEIAKVISNDIKVLIMDEPTSALNDFEIDYLFSFIKGAAERGIAIIYISHKLDEIFAIANRVVVLRDGHVTGMFSVDGVTREELISSMVGRNLEEMYQKSDRTTKKVMLEVRNLTDENLTNISFQAYSGEILGVYGLLGSGHQDLGPAIYGQTIRQSGEILLGGAKVEIKEPLDALKLGIAYVPAERKIEGLILGTTIRENLMVSSYAKQSHYGLIDKKAEQSAAKKWIQNLQIRTPSEEVKTEFLSGGNQQKVVLSKCLELEPSVLILNEPTRGIDVGAKAEIYNILNDLCKKGKCIIMVTSEMPELLANSDRVMVMFEGKVKAILENKDAAQETVLKYAIGG